MRTSFAFATLLLFGPALFADQVTLKNGDVITGTIVKKDGGKLTLKSDILGEVTMPWDAVTSIKSEKPVYVVLPTGQVNGTLATQGSELQVQSAAKSESAPLAKVGAIRDDSEQHNYERLLHPKWTELWGGYFDLGFSIARGNAYTDTLTTGFNAVRPTSTDKTTVFFNQIYSTAKISGVNSSTADAARGGISYDHNVNPKLFLNAFTTEEYDRFQNLDFRLVGGGGLGFHAFKNDKGFIDLAGGGDYSHSSYSTPSTTNLAEVYGGDDLGYKLGKGTSFTQAFRIFGAPSDSSYRMNFDVGASTVLRKWLSWQITGSDRYLSNPAVGRKSNDILLTTGFRVTFAH